MRKKIMFLFGIIFLSIFLFIQPIKAETETVGIIPTDDVSVSCEWDRDDFFLRGFSSNPTNEESFFGVENRLGGEYEEHRPYFKYDLPNIPNKVIVSIELRVYVAPYFFETDIIPQFDWNISIDLVANNWNEYSINWTHGRPEYMNETIDMVIEEVQTTYVYRRFDLTYFKDFIENDTLSFCMIPSKLYDNYLTEGYMGWHSKEGFVPGEDVNPYLIVEYEDIRPPTPFLLTSNAGNPDRDGIFVLQWTDSDYANDYSIYRNNSLIESGFKNNVYLMEISTNGSYVFKIVALNEFGYNNSNEIIINVEIQDIPPNSFVLTSDADNPDIDGVFSLQWTTSEYAEDYSLYMNDTLIHSGLKVFNYYMENYLNGKYVFRVEAFNYFGNTSSNEIIVNVEIPKPYPGADYFYADLDQYYGAFVAYNADEYDFFNASVWSENIITGYIMDESNYNQWVAEGIIQPSSNIDYVNFGIANRWHTFTPTRADTWYFVFINVFAEHTHLDAYIYFYEDYFTEPEQEPEPVPIGGNDFIIPSIIGFSLLGLVVVIGEIYRIKKVRNFTS